MSIPACVCVCSLKNTTKIAGILASERLCFILLDGLQRKRERKGCRREKAEREIHSPVKKKTTKDKDNYDQKET